MDKLNRMLPRIKKNLTKVGSEKRTKPQISPRVFVAETKISLPENRKSTGRNSALRNSGENFSKSTKNLQHIFIENNIEEEQEFYQLVNHLNNRRYSP